MTLPLMANEKKLIERKFDQTQFDKKEALEELKWKKVNLSIMRDNLESLERKRNRKPSSKELLQQLVLIHQEIAALGNIKGSESVKTAIEEKKKLAKKVEFNYTEALKRENESSPVKENLVRKE